MTLYLDANVLFTACISPDGASAILFVLARAGTCSLISSGHPVEEARRNIAAKYPESLAELDSLVRQIKTVPEASHVLANAAQEYVPAKDAPILAAALANGAAMLVTGDKAHFGHLFGTRIGDATVLPPREAVEYVVRQDSPPG